MMARRVPIVRPRDERLPLPSLPRDWRYTAAALCGIVVSVGFVAALVLAMAASR